MSTLKKGAIAAVLVLLAACQSTTPEEQARLAAQREAANSSTKSWYMPLVPRIAQVCAARVQGQNANADFLVQNGFQKKRALGRDFYIRESTVPGDTNGIIVRMPEGGCSFILPTTGAIDPAEHRAALIKALQANGFSVGAAIDPSKAEANAGAAISGALLGASINTAKRQTARKGNLVVEMKSVFTRSSYGSSWEEFILAQPSS